MNIENGSIKYEADECRSGVCLLCGHECLDYGGSDSQGGYIVAAWECPSCGASGKEINKKVFDGHIVTDIPDHRPKNRVYTDSAGDKYCIRSGIGGTFKGFRILSSPHPFQRKERGIEDLRYLKDRVQAQRELDIYAAKNNLTEIQNAEDGADSL